MKVNINISQYLCKFFGEEDKMWVYYLSDADTIGSVVFDSYTLFYDYKNNITDIKVLEGNFTIPHNDLMWQCEQYKLRFKDVNTIEVFKIRSIKSKYFLRHCKTDTIIIPKGHI